MKSTALIFFALFFAFNIKGQTLVFYKSSPKSEYHFYQKQKLTLILQDGTKYKGQIDSFNENEIILNTKAGQIMVDNKKIKGFTVRRHIWYFGAHWSSLIQYNKHRDLEGYKYKIRT
jgi:sRNA-binding regulator protein Hfq